MTMQLEYAIFRTHVDDVLPPGSNEADVDLGMVLCVARSARFVLISISVCKTRDFSFFETFDVVVNASLCKM